MQRVFVSVSSENPTFKGLVRKEGTMKKMMRRWWGGWPGKKRDASSDDVPRRRLLLPSCLRDFVVSPTSSQNRESPGFSATMLRAATVVVSRFTTSLNSVVREVGALLLPRKSQFTKQFPNSQPISLLVKFCELAR